MPATPLAMRSAACAQYRATYRCRFISPFDPPPYSVERAAVELHGARMLPHPERHLQEVDSYRAELETLIGDAERVLSSASLRTQKIKALMPPAKK